MCHTPVQTTARLRYDQEELSTEAMERRAKEAAGAVQHKADECVV